MTIFKNEPLSNHTTFRIGGRADVLIVPDTIDEIFPYLQERHIIIGNGSNILFSDNGFRGVVIKTTNLNNISINNRSITADCGAMLSKIASLACTNQLSGLEFAAGIPGTLGGAIFMNAGAFGGQMADVVVQTSFLENGKIKTINNKEHEFEHRQSFFSKNKDLIILSTQMELQHTSSAAIEQTMKKYAKQRASTQPLEKPSAGSTFKRPKNNFAGKLIQDCGLSGKQIGGAAISEKHCGFIVNLGDAKAKDVIDLIEFTKKTVYEQTGVKLEEEIKCVL